MKKLLKNITRFVLIALILVISGGVWFLRSGIPAKSSTYELGGLSHNIKIVKDGHGIPYIRATTREDAAFAMGFVHAQDRLFQMDMMRRYASGQLSEVFGERTLKTDKFMRSLRFRSRAKDDFSHLSPDVKKTLQAYVNGVNAYLENRKEKQAPEFTILGYTPAPWTAIDSLMWQKNMALTLSHNWKHDLLRGRMSKMIAPQDFDKFWPATPANSPVTVKPFMTPLKDNKTPQPAPSTKTNTTHILSPKDDHIPDATQASNAWVISGKHTISGKPLLANDPHLKLSTPGVWYLVRVDLPDNVLAGASAPGIPGIVLGRNAHHAWGCTTTRGDVQDVFIEKLHPEDKSKYKTPDGYNNFKEFHEEIKIKGQKPYKLIIRESRHGVVLTGLIDPADTDKDDEVYTLAWTGLHQQDKTFESLYRMNFGKSFEAFKEAVKLFHAPQQNVHYADVEGNIGYIAPARLPQRKKGDGTLPVPGWSGEYDWTPDYIPFIGLPQLFNPEGGIIFNANNKVVDSSHPYHITHDYDTPPHRAIRLESLLKTKLDSKKKFNILDMRNYQLDIKTLLFDQFKPFIAEATPETEGGKIIQAALLNWDGIMHREMTEPLMFEAWTKMLHEVAFKDQIGPYYDQYMMWKPEAVRHVLANGQESCSKVQGTWRPICHDKVSEAFDKTDTLLTEHFGKNKKSWLWGRAHKAKFKHQIFSKIPLLNIYSDREIETSGHRYTLNEGGTYLLPLEDFTQMNGPGYRAIYDLGNLDASLYMITPGQSGHFLSQNYHDLAEKWEAGLYVRLPKKPLGKTAKIKLRVKK